MSREDLIHFRLLGHDCPLGRYPAPVVPIGKLGDKLVAIYISEKGDPEPVEISKLARYIKHDSALTSELSTYNVMTDLLFALSAHEVKSYGTHSEKVNLLEYREADDDPFYRLALSSATDQVRIIEQDIRSCLRYIVATAPDLAEQWYAKKLDELRARSSALNLPTDFRFFLDPEMPSLAYYGISEPGPMRQSTSDVDKPLIRLDGVTKIFYSDELETHALTDIYLSIFRGQYVRVSGPSGSGKSTLLSILGLLDTPSSGEYFLNGRPVSKLSPSERALVRNRDIGFIFQNPNLIPDLNVQENVDLPLTYQTRSSSDRRQRVLHALERVNMAHRMEHFPPQLSGGQQQRVSIARAIAANPLILLADEPTGNLDSRNGEVVMELLRELHASGMTICLVTHDSRYKRNAGHLVSMVDGRIVEEAELPVYI
jgi:putative ABC transport system ATP-binding protein